MNVVPEELTLTDAPRCGFLGVTTRTTRDANGLMMYEAIELPFNFVP